MLVTLTVMSSQDMSASVSSGAAWNNASATDELSLARWRSLVAERIGPGSLLRQAILLKCSLKEPWPSVPLPWPSPKPNWDDRFAGEI